MHDFYRMFGQFSTLHVKGLMKHCIFIFMSLIKGCKTGLFSGCINLNKEKLVVTKTISESSK